MAEHLMQQDGALVGIDDGYLFINDGPETITYQPEAGFAVDEATTCRLAPITETGGDHSWLGAGKIALNGLPALNGRLKLEPITELQPVAPLVLGGMPTHYARRVLGYTLTLTASDLSLEVLALAVSGGVACLTAELHNMARSRATALRIAATVSFSAAPIDPTRDDYTHVDLAGRVIGTPQIEQETDDD